VTPHDEPGEPGTHRPAVVLLPGDADTAALVDAGAGSLAPGGSLVAIALLGANAAAYVLAVAASRLLSADAYGQLTALLGVLLVASVPALAVQAVVARSLARRPAGEASGPRERTLLLRSAATGAAVAAVAALAAPLLAAFLHVGVAGPLWLAVGLVPFALQAAVQGILQGSERFGLLAVLIGLQALGKAAGLVPLLLGGGPAAVLAALAAGTALVAGLGLLVVRTGPGGARPAGLPGRREVALAAGGLLGLLALANLDLLLARHLLDGTQSGRYAVGSVLAKVAFWLPQAVAVVALPRLTDPEGGRRLLRAALAVVAGLGALEVAGAVLLARPVLELVFGPAYGSLSAVAPLFVLQGAALATVQLVVYRSIALGRGVTGWLLVAAGALEVLVVLAVRPTGVAGVVGVAATTAVALAVLAVLADERLPRRGTGGTIGPVRPPTRSGRTP